MVYRFDTTRWRDILKAAFNTSTGHDHDGVNSKAVTVGTVADNAITAGKIAADAVTTVKILNANVTAAKLATDAVETAKIKDANVTLAKMSVAARTRIFTYAVEDLAAAADIAARTIMVVPSGIDITLVSVGIIPLGSSAGVDDSNTVIIALTDDAAASSVGKTYNTGTQPPASGVIGDLGALSSPANLLSAGQSLKLAVTQGGSTSNMPGFLVQIIYTVAVAA